MLLKRFCWIHRPEYRRLERTERRYESRFTKMQNRLHQNVGGHRQPYSARASNRSRTDIARRPSARAAPTDFPLSEPSFEPPTSKRRKGTGKAPSVCPTRKIPFLEKTSLSLERWRSVERVSLLKGMETPINFEFDWLHRQSTTHRRQRCDFEGHSAEF